MQSVRNRLIFCRIRPDVPISFINKVLGFDDMKTCTAFLRAHGAYIVKPDMTVDSKLSNIQKQTVVASNE